MAMGMSMYGFSNVMIDVCGTKGALDEQLCGRWMQVAAFLPMARNYYALTYVDDKGETQITPGSEFVNFKDFKAKVMCTSSL